MRKYFIYLFAAVALMSACTETGPMEKPANRKDSGKSLFIGTIEQPGSPLTKTTVTEDSDAERASITWEAGDEILVYGNATDTPFSFYADQSGDEANFWNADAGVPAWLTANDDAGYVAYYPAYAKVFYNDKKMPETDIELSCDKDGINQVALENMPLVAELMNAGPGYKNRPLRFECKYAILKVTMPESFECDKMTITCGEEEMLAAVSDLADGPKVVYVPIYKDDYDFSGLKIKVNCEPEAVMQIYGGEDLPADVPDPIFEPNAIYAFNLCNTLTIDKAGEYTLAANTLDYKINISAAIATGPVEIKYADSTTEANAPKNIFINARGHNVDDLTINTPYSHVEIQKGEAKVVSTITALNSFVVKPSFTINTATVSGGSIVVEGDENHDANVSEIVVPKEAENVRVYVGDIKDDSVKPVSITNHADKDDVVVVGIKAGDDGKGEYTVKQEGTGEVTEVSSAVAKIGDAQYATLADAFASAKDGETVTLVSSTVLSAQVELAGKAITLDLNGQTISWNGGQKGSGIILVHNGADLTINDTVGTGKIYSGGENQAYAAVALTKSGDSDASPAVLTVNGGELEGWYYAVVGNGTRHNTKIVINGGTVKGTAEGSAGIYNPQDGTITINGGTIVGDGAGIYMKAGSAAVANGGTVKATGAKGTYKPAQSGFEPTGDAIIVDNCGYPGGAPSLTINGAELVSVNAYQVGAYYDGKNATEISDILSSDNTLSVPAGYEWQEDATSGMYKLVKAAATSKIGDKEYATLADAFADVPADGTQTTIVLVADVALEGNAGVAVNAGQNVVLDLNGKTLSNMVNESKASQIIENKGTLTITGNGTITNALADGVIPGDWPTYNYATNLITNLGTLTIENGTFNNTQDSGITYALDNNSNGVNAKATINGGTFKSVGNAAVRMFCNSTTATNDLIINGGYFEGNYYAVSVSNARGATKVGTLTVNGGEFESRADEGNACIANWVSNKSSNITVNIAGGKFNDYVLIASKANVTGGLFKYNQYTDPDDSSVYSLADYVAAGYAVVDNTDASTSADYPYTVAEAPGVKVNGQEGLNDAVKDAKAGDVIEIVAAGTYTIPNIPNNITIKGGVSGVVFNCEGSGSIASVPNGATFENVAMNFGQNNYHGFQHAGTINMNGCTLNGFFFSYGDMNFNGCTFNQDTGEYMMWDYGKDLTYTDCVFNGHGKFINVYNEGNGNWKLTVTGCTFNSDKANKSALNIKASSGATNLGWDVIIKDCKVNDEKMFPVASGDDKSTLFVGSPIWQVDDRTASSLEANIVKVTVDDVVVYGRK